MWAFNQYAVIWQSYALYLLRPFGIFKIRNIAPCAKVFLSTFKRGPNHVLILQNVFGLHLLLKKKPIFYIQVSEQCSTNFKRPKNVFYEPFLIYLEKVIPIECLFRFFSHISWRIFCKAVPILLNFLDLEKMNRKPQVVLMLQRYQWDDFSEIVSNVKTL